MNDLIGKTIQRPEGHGYKSVKILSISDGGDCYNCLDIETGAPFQASKEIYDRMFIPKGDKEIKPLHYKGESDHRLFRRRK